MTVLTKERQTLAQTVESSIAGAPPGRSLARNQLRFVRTIALSVGIQGPVAGVIVGPAVLASLVGGAGALAYLLGLVAMAFVAYAFVIFSRSFNSAGSVYTFNGAALGAAYGFVSAWILLLVYISFAGAVYASTADIAQTLFASFGVHLWWVWFALAGFVPTMLFAYRSIRISTVVIFVCEGIAVVLLAIVGIVVLAHGGYHHHAWSLAPFSTHGIALGVLGLGVVNAFGAFSGFELAVGAHADDHEAAEPILAEADLEVDPVDPDVDVVGVLERALAEQVVLLLPRSRQAVDDRAREAGTGAEELRQRRHEITGREAVQVEQRQHL